MVRKQITSNLFPCSLWNLVAHEWSLAVCLLRFSACFTALYPFLDLFIHSRPEYMLSCSQQACFDLLASVQSRCGS